MNGLLPAEPGLRAHCRRVSLIASTIARLTSVSARSIALLEEAAWLHHVPGLGMDNTALRRLAADVENSGGPRAENLADLPEALTSLLKHFHNFPATARDRKEQTLTEILALANWLDEQIEGQDLEETSGQSVWESLEPLKGLFRNEIWSAARRAFPASLPIQRWDLPIQADIAKEFIHLMQGDAEWETAQLARLANQDPTLAGKLVQAANSPLFENRTRIRSVRQAVAYLGIDASRRIMAGLVARSLFGSSRAQAELWKHSVWVAHFVEKIAREKGFMNPEEALLAGLVHDVGRLAISKQTMPPAHAHLSQQEAPNIWTERLLFGIDHCEIGARILDSWRFPDSIVTAVRLHHRPADTDSPLAAAIYAAEFWSATDEDLPSLRHLNAALARVDCGIETLAGFQRPDETLKALLAVA